VAMMLLLTLRGTPTLYQGDELGIGEVAIPPARVQDPRELRQPGIGLGRDPSRTPMAWDDSANAGFSYAEPWLPLHADWHSRNVAAQGCEAGSMLSLTRALLKLRKSEAALEIGTLRLLEAPPGVLAYERTHQGRALRIVLNFTSQAVAFPWEGTVLFSTLGGEAEPGMLFADEGLVIA
jgi:alpha-glucosidase